ncbi:MAG: hypothetical protein EAY75_16305 [Bacteroidetes bacterium]|nr:MAG: hypothetical protein EAY75_16305 [Bacteroidota bacterium]
MAKIAGVATTKNANGEIATITINMKKHGKALMPIFKEMGILEKTQFEKECEKAISVEETFNKVHEYIKSLPWKK